jgi:hypothetical protein
MALSGDAVSGLAVIREPLTKLVMLRPQASNDVTYKQLTDWTYQGATAAGGVWWLGVRRGLPSGTYAQPPLAASALPAGASEGGIAITPSVTAALSYAVIAGGPSGDTLVWALESNLFNLDRDAGFTMSCTYVGDPYLGARNGVLAQWDRYALHVTPQGRVRAYQWASASDISGTPKLIDEWEWEFGVEEITVIPLPHRGYGVYASGPTGINSASAHLVAIDWQSDSDGSYYWATGKVRIAINPKVRWVIGYAVVTYPTSAQVVYDAPHALDAPPLTGPSTVNVGNVGVSALTSVSLSWVKPDYTAIDWTTALAFTPKITLSTSNSLYTPYLAGYQPLWAPVFESRATTEWSADLLKNLSITHTWDGRVEGSCEIEVRGAEGRKALERGDMSVVVERKDRSEGATWKPVLIGLGQVDGQIDLDYDPAADTMVYTARVALRDWRYRLSEVRMTRSDSLDGLTIRQALDRILEAAGIQPLLSAPSALDSIKMPSVGTDGKRPRWMPKRGDDAEKVVRDILLLARKKDTEFLLVQAVDDASAGNRHRLKVIQRPRPTSSAARWTLTAVEGQHDPTQGVVEYTGLGLDPSPPEANAVRVEGYDEEASKDGAKTERLKYATQVLVNRDSLYDTSKRSYLGRIKYLIAAVQGLQSQHEADLMARRLYDAIATERLVATLQSRYWVEEFSPNTYTRLKFVLAGAEATLLDGWITRRTMTIDQQDGCEAPTVVYEIDTAWGGRVAG